MHEPLDVAAAWHVSWVNWTDVSWGLPLFFFLVLALSVVAATVVDAVRLGGFFERCLVGRCQEYELQRQLMLKLKCLGVNAAFSLRSDVSEMASLNSFIVVVDVVVVTSIDVLG